jgi:hypothetical protein
MKRPLCYHGFEIEPGSQQLSETGYWTLRVFITRYEDNRIRVREFLANNEYRSGEEAVKHCLLFGKRIIDGHIRNCSVEDLAL